ncbi:flagellar hook-basal body protein [Desulfurobacterium atlanticum]|uniref:Flagellar basal-body rod protein FlgG n=1 Tax=Desulfurobacterium atlanticum TaxID=240169 RepID=A0A238ZZ28_9BACT|nr:flagellar hook-basal body protein [Desulfurobacterium atlanticum]SNR88570.1 flagellar basal-body rod protein FlgG [Desulfurobacterium atlanticum]
MAVDIQSIYMLASGGKRALEQLDTVSNNIANVNTPGFKKLLEVEMYQDIPVNRGESGKLLTFPRFRETLPVLSQGSLQKTDSPLDFAISGKGFFKVETKSGILLTRNGHFHIDKDGYLVDANGNKVLSKENNPIIIDTNQPFNVSSDGRVLQGAIEVAVLGIEDYESVEPVGNSYYVPAGDVKPAEYKVLTGFLESSNVEPIKEMVNLIETQRRFEIYGNLIRGLDRMNMKSVEIGKV